MSRRFDPACRSALSAAELACAELSPAERELAHSLEKEPVKESVEEPMAEPVEAAPYVGSKAPPPQYDAMRAPVYVPDAAPALRPGAMDYQRHASRGHRC